MKKLLPIVLILLGIGGGIGAGIALKPAPPVPETMAEGAPCGDDPNAEDVLEITTPELDKPERPDDVSFEYAELKNQFVVPVIRGENVSSMVIIAITLEVVSGTAEDVFTVEPRLRDSFLQAFFDHAANGGFDGAFANNQNLMRLRRSLMERGVDILGDRLNDVLITDIARQDM